MANNRDNIIFEIILVLIKENLHLRNIARRLETHHSVIARKLKYLVEDNVLDYNTEGMNKVFYIKKFEIRNIS